LIELLEWRTSVTVAVPDRSDAKPRKTRFVAESFTLPEVLQTEHFRAKSFHRESGAVTVEGAVLTAERETYRALGFVFLAYALGPQTGPFRLHLSNAASDELTQIVLWPGQFSHVESKLGFRQRVSEIHYRASLPEGNPNYTTHEQDDADYPREHLPYCRLGSPEVEGGGLILKDHPVALHFQGTAPSLVWFGKYLLNLALADNNCRLAYLYNFGMESLGHGSAELRITVANPVHGPVFLPL
jgi:hypothetical protein